MDCLIILMLIYVVLLFVLNIKSNRSHNACHNLIIFLSIICIFIGCATSLNFVYGFLVAYILLVVDFLIGKGSRR